jgi:phosphoglucosamine mutase
MVSVSSEKIGKAYRHEQPLGRYIEFCKSTFDRSVNLNNLNLVIDCANGATYHIAENVFSELGANVNIINNTPDGFNINKNCGATDTKHLQQVVLETGADLGIAFDGDGDRLMMVDHMGNMIDGDQLVFIVAKAWKSQNRLTNNSVVGTKMTNLGMRHALRDLDIQFIEADVGDRYVMEEMKRHGAVLGGEGSGHMICLDKTTSGDGIVAALQVLEVLVKSQVKLAELVNDMVKYPQVLINVKTKDKVNLDNHQALIAATKEVEAVLGDEGRVLIRASGTEPLIRVMVEAKNASTTQQCAEKLADILR